MFLLDIILEILDKKNDWCTLEEIASRTKSSESEITTLLTFLAEHGFVTVDTDNRKAKINPKIRKFLQEVRQAEILEATSARETGEISVSNSHTP